jgi:hypothetical protein
VGTRFKPADVACEKGGLEWRDSNSRRYKGGESHYQWYVSLDEQIDNREVLVREDMWMVVLVMPLVNRLVQSWVVNTIVP